MQKENWFFRFSFFFFPNIVLTHKSDFDLTSINRTALRLKWPGCKTFYRYLCRVLLCAKTDLNGLQSVLPSLSRRQSSPRTRLCTYLSIMNTAMRLWLRPLCMILRTFCTHASNNTRLRAGSRARWHTAKCWMGERRCALTHGRAACRSAGMRWSVWVMRRECRSLGMRGWSWRARLSGSAAEQLILGGFCRCCFCTHCYNTLLFCSVS